MVDLLRQIISIPAVSFQEENRCSFLQKHLESVGIPCLRVGNNLIATQKSYDPDKKTIALDAHIDTVPPSPQYSRDPFDSGKDDNIIYGLGSNDDGGSVVTMIDSFRHFFDKQLPVNLLLVLSCEEEKLGAGGAAGLYGPNGFFRSHHWESKAALTHNDAGTIHSDHINNPHGEFEEQNLNHPDWVIVGEPTGMKVATSERGLLVIDGYAQGRSGHAAREEGINALYIALDDIARIRNHSFERVSERMGKVKCSVTQIEAGSVHNVVPDSCRFVVDVRPTELYTNEEILSELQSLCSSTLTPRRLDNRSSATPKDSRLLQTARVLGLTEFSSPTTSDWMKVGCEAIKMGPGNSARSHRADEYILSEELIQAKAIYIEFIEKFCDGYTLE